MSRPPVAILVLKVLLSLWVLGAVRWEETACCVFNHALRVHRACVQMSVLWEKKEWRHCAVAELESRCTMLSVSSLSGDHSLALLMSSMTCQTGLT